MIDKPTVGRLPIGEFVLPICLRWPTGLVVTYRVFRYTCTGAHPPPTKVSHSHKPAQGFKRLIAILNWYSFGFNKEKIITAFKIQRPYQHLTCERDLLYMCLLNSWAFAYQYQNVCKGVFVQQFQNVAISCYWQCLSYVWPMTIYFSLFRPPRR